MRTVLLVYGVLATPFVLALASFILSGRHRLHDEAARTAQENESC